MRIAAGPICALLLAGCAVQGAADGAPAAARPPAAQGAALANCERAMWRRTGGAVRITKVTIFEQQRGLIEGRTAFGTQLRCFTDARGEAVHVMVDRRLRF